MLHLTLKYCKAIICLSALLLTSVCGSAQYYRHYHLVPHVAPWAIDYRVMNLNDIARHAVFEGIVLHNCCNEAKCVHQCAASTRADLVKLCAEEMAINATGALAYDLLSLTNINDRDLRNVGIGIACAQLALSASAINKAEQARKEAIVAQEAAPDSTLNVNDKQIEQRCENRAAKAITTLALIEAAAWTLDAIFGDYPRAPRHRYYHHHRRHYYPYY